MRILLLAVLLTGCASRHQYLVSDNNAEINDLIKPVKRIHYAFGVDVVVENAAQTDHDCLADKWHWDDGRPVLPGDHSCGCIEFKYAPGATFNPTAVLDHVRPGVSCTVYINDACPDALTHELGHCDGVVEPDNHGYNWPDAPEAQKVAKRTEADWAHYSFYYPIARAGR